MALWNALQDFLRDFVTFWPGSIRQYFPFSAAVRAASAPSPYDDGPIGSNERLSRFIFDRKAFSAKTGSINFREFLPPKKEPYTEECSVVRTAQLSEDAVWVVGRRIAARTTRRPVRARGDFKRPAAKLSQTGGWQLDVQPSLPPPRHAVITGWPPVRERDKRKSLAQQLRVRAQLVVR